MYKAMIFGLLFIALNGCKWVDNPVSGQQDNKIFILTDAVAVSYKQTIYNEHENISLRFSSLVSDGRCPINWRCVWEGNAEVKFSFTARGKETTFSLNTYSRYTRDTTIAQYNIRMINLKPYPHSERTYLPTQYQAYVIVSKDERLK